VHEHCGDVGMRLQYLIWPEMGRKGGRRRWGGSGFHRRRWRHGVLRAGVSEGSEEAARKLLRVDVVLLVPLAGVKRLCIGGSTARQSGGGALSSPALWKMLLGCIKAKLDGSVSCSGSRWCFSSTGSRVRGGVGG
jgi:hypothetical protein